MIELLLMFLFVAMFAASCGFVFGVVMAGARSFEAGRDQGRRDAQRPLPTSYRLLGKP